MSAARTREVAERLVAVLLARDRTLPAIVCGHEEAELPTDYVAVRADTLTPDGTGGVRCELTVTANVPADGVGMAAADAMEHVLLTAALRDLDALAEALYGQPKGFVRGWEAMGREDTPADAERVLCVAACAVTLPPCETPG